MNKVITWSEMVKWLWASHVSLKNEPKKLDPVRGGHSVQLFDRLCLWGGWQNAKYKKNMYHSSAVTHSFIGVLLNFTPLYHLLLSPEVISSHSSETIFSVFCCLGERLKIYLCKQAEFITDPAHLLSTILHSAMTISFLHVLASVFCVLWNTDIIRTRQAAYHWPQN